MQRLAPAVLAGERARIPLQTPRRRREGKAPAVSGSPPPPPLLGWPGEPLLPPDALGAVAAAEPAQTPQSPATSAGSAVPAATGALASAAGLRIDQWWDGASEASSPRRRSRRGRPWHAAFDVSASEAWRNWHGTRRAAADSEALACTGTTSSTSTDDIILASVDSFTDLSGYPPNINDDARFEPERELSLGLGQLGLEEDFDGDDCHEIPYHDGNAGAGMGVLSLTGSSNVPNSPFVSAIKFEPGGFPVMFTGAGCDIDGVMEKDRIERRPRAADELQMRNLSLSSIGLGSNDMESILMTGLMYDGTHQSDPSAPPVKRAKYGAQSPAVVPTPLSVAHSSTSMNQNPADLTAGFTTDELGETPRRIVSDDRMRQAILNDIMQTVSCSSDDESTNPEVNQRKHLPRRPWHESQEDGGMRSGSDTSEDSIASDGEDYTRQRRCKRVLGGGAVDRTAAVSTSSSITNSNGHRHNRTRSVTSSSSVPKKSGTVSKALSKDDRPFKCTVEGCKNTLGFRKMKHFNEHVRSVHGAAVICPVKGCHARLSKASNVKRHLNEQHNLSAATRASLLVSIS